MQNKILNLAFISNDFSFINNFYFLEILCHNPANHLKNKSLPKNQIMTLK